MKILLVNNVYNQGSTGKIIEDMRAGLEQRGLTVCVAYGRGRKVKSPHIYRLGGPILLKIQSLFSKITGYAYRCSPITTYRLFKIITKEQPDIVNIQCPNANTLNLVQTIEYLKKHNIKTILTSHTEFLYTGGCGHAFNCDQWKTGCIKCPQFKAPNSYCPKSFFFDRCKQQWLELAQAYHNFKSLVIVGTSPWSVERMKVSPFFKRNEMVTIYNGLNTAIFKYYDTIGLRKKLRIGDKKVVLHVTPNFYSPLKGGRFVKEIAQRLINDAPNAVLIIVGYNGDGTDLPANTIPISHTQNQQELAMYYSLAHMTLLTSEREVFSMVCAESLCCGTPVIGFKAGGPESIAIPEYSTFVKYGDVDTLYQKILQYLNNEKISISIERAHKFYSRETMNDKYFKLITRMFDTDYNNN